MSFIRNFFIQLANSKGQFANKLRRKRFEKFVQFFRYLAIGNKINILDVGGRVYFWENMNFLSNNVDITILNLNIEDTAKHPNVKCVKGDACSMPEFPDKSFDIVFSNSVIEHVGDFDDQKRMADEIKRIGKTYFVQTPSYWFPMEPHFLTIGFQFLPIKVRAFLLRHFSLGWFKRTDDYQESIKIASSIQLLTKKDVKKLFPGADVVNERFFGSTKSYMIFKGQN
jgi:2-polyprenyl-3-methyl-5-hydroxy-6-metoxy-1,4-benzoquinol methylase